MATDSLRHRRTPPPLLVTPPTPLDDIPENWLYCFVIDTGSPTPPPLRLPRRHRSSQRPPKSPAWKDRLLFVSNLASLFCMIDCTVLPALTLMPVVSNTVSLEGFHEMGHYISLWLVLPMALLATVVNYWVVHGRWWIASVAAAGMLAVWTANVGCGLGHDLEDMLPLSVGQAVHELLHFVSHGVPHRVTNLLGCALLLAANRLSKRYSDCRDDNCWC